jgi:hypothetical protein
VVGGLGDEFEDAAEYGDREVGCESVPRNGRSETDVSTRGSTDKPEEDDEPVFP